MKDQLVELTSAYQEISTGYQSVTVKYKDEQKTRKRVLNELEDIKGKVRVYARIRPFTKKEATDALKNKMCVTIHDEFSLTVSGKAGREKSFNFDSVFGPDSTQDQVFEDTRRLIQSAIDGYNVCIFAYGQTGSGKTFTVQGTEEKPGITPRSIVELFGILSRMNDYEIKLSCTMVELYLNQLNDLLLPKGAEPVPLDIKETPSGMIEIVGVTEREIMSVSETDKIFDMGMNRRKTRATAMNDTSSRSHLIFAIKIDVYNVNTKQKTLGKISFVDLAGSEKSAKTGTTKEG